VKREHLHSTFEKVVTAVAKLKVLSLAFILAALAAASCATKQPPVAYHNQDNTALVIQSVDGTKSQLIQPAGTGLVDNKAIVDKAKSLPVHRTAVVILENYSEPQIGMQFRDRSIPWFIVLRGLGFERIVFLQGHGVADPEGLPTLVSYN
jgi:hypothetical protein